MTITVKVLIEGNKVAQVSKFNPQTRELEDHIIVKPGEFATKYISGDEQVCVKEKGPFLS